jgi:pimeloyl-ACP methyl ester carboxylesterase
VNLLGHSYGALSALEAALLTRNVGKLVLYEPPTSANGAWRFPSGVIDRLEALLEAGDRDGVITTTMREVAGLSPETVEQLRSLPVWQARVDAAHTIPRELRATEAYHFDAARFERLGVPTLLLLGGASPAVFEEAEVAVNGTLPNSRIVVMPGQGHAAMDTATDLFTTEVLRFLGTDLQGSAA